MDDIALVTPMAGLGVRFQRSGIPTPKPLLDLWGRPFFWWATESVLRSVQVRELVFVVLADHVEQFGIDAKVRETYPMARIVALSEPSSGAAESAAIGVAALATNGPIAVNDCDHAFRADGLRSLVGELTGTVEGALLGFRADDPRYSYIRFDGAGRVVGTAEKQVVSRLAIAGCYLFAGPAMFLARYAAYRESCPYDELFVSGVYNTILDRGGEVLVRELADHVSFGTPEEYEKVHPNDLSFVQAEAR
jgi:dTDP-glucose pyrophosphorylase